MNTNRIIGVLAGAALLLSATPALAASTISNIKFDNGQTQTSCTPGQTLNVTFRVTVPSGEVAELGQVDVLGDSLAPALPTTLGDNLGLQEGAHDVTASVTCPQNTAYYTVEYRTAGIYGGQQAVNITDGVVSVGSFSNAIRVVADGSTTSGGSSTTTSGGLWGFNSFADFLAAIKAALGTSGSTTPPAPSALCANFTSAKAGLYQGSMGAAGLQTFLISNGEAGILTYGATGYYGVQTAQAVSAFAGAHSCN